MGMKNGKVCIGEEAQKESELNLSDAMKSNYLALDCEMVGVGEDGSESVLARATLVDWYGKIVYDQYVRPSQRITDFRTWVSGVRSKHLVHAIPTKQCIQEVANLVKDKVLVGHALKNDLQVLYLSHPPHLVRDTGKYQPFMKRRGKDGKTGKLMSRKLKDLVSEVLGEEIQVGTHDSREDAYAAMKLYRRVREEWESTIYATPRGKQWYRAMK